MQITRFSIAVMLGVILSMVGGAASAQAFTVSTTMNYPQTAEGTCKSRCQVRLFAQAEGAAEPVHYTWYDDSPASAQRVEEGYQSVVFDYFADGTYTPTVKVTDATGETVYASPGSVEVVDGPGAPVDIYLPTRAKVYSKTTFRVYSDNPNQSVTWQSSGSSGRAEKVSDCSFANPGEQCWRIPAAPQGSLMITATAGGETDTEEVRYLGQPAGSWKERFAIRRSGRRCRITARLNGAAGMAYRYRGRLVVQYRFGTQGAYRRLSQGTRSRSAPARYVPGSTVGSVKKVISYSRLVRLARQGAQLRLVTRHVVTIDGRNYGPKPSKRRFRPAACRTR